MTKKSVSYQNFELGREISQAFLRLLEIWAQKGMLVKAVRGWDLVSKVKERTGYGTSLVVQWLKILKHSPANAGDTGLIPGLGRFHMPQGNQAHIPQLLKLARLEPVLHNKRNHHREKVCTPHLEKV